MQRRLNHEHLLLELIANASDSDGAKVKKEAFDSCLGRHRTSHTVRSSDDMFVRSILLLLGDGAPASSV